MAKLFLVRHGQSQWNLENRFTGWKDVDITELGEEEAQRAGQSLKDEQIDRAFTSKLVRAQHTLNIILDECGNTDIPVIMNEALNERSYGDLEGLNKAETAQNFGAEQVHIWRRSFDIAPPGGESLKDTYDRVIPYFESNIKPQLEQHKNVLIVAHGNSLRALIMYLEHLSPEEILKREIATGEPLTYVFDEQMNAVKLGRLTTHTSNEVIT
ncbi:phosphoglycerate mutase [Chryseobacterium oranimense]|uniref:2,3-bisphosphoglycerate-dependent phosphoglycerate mutase n=1 Tax=Chryseobacterium oranimense TaxID=421058 RepID=A0A1M5REG8_9FLAO|nr:MULTISPECIES: 2,3-diphosphoglycerate-dependent phosphoglycerate mutase [Weeksellaceae]MCL1672899.1 2,3-diphosphoglycerate-dependent phosphoglycerate mutase [Elizabethkingia ursingii]SHH24520.1 phosphoglycerate mutase [Chryseobacterium oranimense]